MSKEPKTPEEEIASLSLSDVIHPESLDHCMTMFSRLMAGEDVGTIEAAFIATDGRRVEREGNISCSFEDGRPVATRASVHVLTERRRPAHELWAR